MTRLWTLNSKLTSNLQLWALLSEQGESRQTQTHTHTQGGDFTRNRSLCDILAVYAWGQTINQSVRFWFLDMNPSVVPPVTHLSHCLMRRDKGHKRYSTRTFSWQGSTTTAPTSSFSFRCSFLDQQWVTVSFYYISPSGKQPVLPNIPGSEAYCNCLTGSYCNCPAQTIWIQDTSRHLSTRNSTKWFHLIPYTGRMFVWLAGVRSCWLNSGSYRCCLTCNYICCVMEVLRFGPSPPPTHMQDEEEDGG